MVRRVSWLFITGLVVTGNVQAADSGIDLYGRVNIAYDFSAGLQDDWKSHVSRIGVKGEFAVSRSLDLVYQFEQEVDLAHGGFSVNQATSTRNSFVGLAGKFGKLFFGTHDTPFKKAQGKVDLFND